MSISTYLQCDVGDKPVATATFTDSSGDLVDPSVVKFGYKTPGEVSSTFTYDVDDSVEKVSTGVYRFTFSADEHGTYQVRVWSTGTGQAAESGEIHVEENPLA